MIAEPLIVTLAGLSGLALGSYAVTAGIRFSRGEPSVTGRSHCDSCGQTLGFAKTLPVVSYLGCRGACSACRSAIDPAHLFGELGGLAVVVSAVATHDLIRAPLLIVLGLLLVATSTVDLKIGRLPNALSLTIAAIAAALAALQSLSSLLIGLVAAAIAFGLLQGLRWSAQQFRGDPGLGFGDVKLICALALWLGAATPWMVVGAAIIGLFAIARSRPANGRLYFGPALAAAAWAVGISRECGAWPAAL